MMFQISKKVALKIRRLAAAAMFFLTFPAAAMADDQQLDSLVAMTVSIASDGSAESLRTCISRLKRIDAMYPDSSQAKYQIAYLCLGYCVSNPEDKNSETFMAEAKEAIRRMDGLKTDDQSVKSDIYALKGLMFIALIVQDPAVNGQRYYLDALDNLDRSLKCNPDNETAKMLKSKFIAELKQAMGS